MRRGNTRRCDRIVNFDCAVMGRASKRSGPWRVPDSSDAACMMVECNVAFQSVNIKDAHGMVIRPADDVVSSLS